MTAPFPTRKDEEWRYADLEALQPTSGSSLASRSGSKSLAGESL